MRIITNLKSFNWKLFTCLLVIGIFPALYQSLRTYFVATTVSTSAFDVLGQMEWFDLINETLQAFLIIPIYSILNKRIKDSENLPKIIFKTGLLSFLLYFLFSVIVFIYGNYLVSFMNPNEIDIDQVNTYLRLETIAFVIALIPSYINVVFVSLNKAKSMYLALIINALFLIIGDYLLLPTFGVNGVAYSNILINSLMAIAGITILVIQKKIKPCLLSKEDVPLLKEWLKGGLCSGGQSFLDNIVYVLMVAKMVNAVSEQGNYWIANNFIWTWLLIPITALAEVIRSDCKEGYKNLKQSNYYLIVFLTVILWFSLSPTWIPFFEVVEHLDNAKEVFGIVIKLVGFYIAYGLTIIPDSIFIGLGKTRYNIVNSLIINLIYYGIFFLLYTTKTITMTMDVIIIMFGLGMVVHEGVSIIQEKIFLKKHLESGFLS